MKQAKVVAGMMYLDGCGHCHALLEGHPSIFDAVAAKVGDNVMLVKIEASEQESKLRRLGLEGKVSVQGGYPTLFRHANGKTTYFLEGERTVDKLVSFFVSKKTKMKTKKNTRKTTTRQTVRKRNPKHKSKHNR